MKLKKPSEMTIEELINKQKTIQLAINILLIVTAFLLLVIVFLF